MKTFQRLLAVLLTAAMMMSLFGCAAPVAQDTHSGHTHAEHTDSIYSNLSNSGAESYDLTQPFDQTYPELAETEVVTYDEDTLLLKLPESMGGTVTPAMAEAGVSALERLFAVEDAVWFEAQLAGNTDIHAAVTALRSIEDILLVDYNYHAEVTGMADPEDIPEELLNNPRVLEQWYLEYCGIPAGLSLLDNPGGTSDIIVAVIDTGVDIGHEDLANNIWFNEYEIPGNYTDDDGNGYTDDYYGVNLISGYGNGDDDHGHGTHVAGIIAAENNDIGVTGLAWNVKIMPIKASSAAGVFNQSDIAKAVMYAYANGAHVINMSFGGTACSVAVQDALSVAFSDCVLVASAGNDGMYNEGFGAIPNYPAALSYVLGVMSVDRTGTESIFTNWDVFAFNGVEYELYAPGENILSTIPNDGYASWSGTSMAAPVVAAMAALVRSQYPDTSEYPSRFIYGQLAATSDDDTICLGPDVHGPHNLPSIVNLHSALTVLPKPDVNMSDYVFFDTKGLTNDQGLNNGDGVIDAGETIALGLTLRNRWGKSTDTIVKLDALSPAGIPDPYITILNDTVNYGSVGTYSEGDCGRIYTDEILTGWANPFYIRIAEDCPNDYWFNLNVTVTCGNGMDDKDADTYTNTASILLLVRNGVLVPQVIDEDMVWTGDKLYIIPDATIIEKGVTVTVEPGAHIQFWSADPNDPYADTKIASLSVAGTLLVEGEKDNQVYIYPCDAMALYPVTIGALDGGYISLKYADVTNAHDNGLMLRYHDSLDRVIHDAEHCTFRMNSNVFLQGRIVNNGSVQDIRTTGGVFNTILNAKDCVFFKISTADSMIFKGYYERCAFIDCELYYGNLFAKDCLFLGNHDLGRDLLYGDPDAGILLNQLNDGCTYYFEENGSGSAIHYREETDTTYIKYWVTEQSDVSILREARLPGDKLVIETQDELDWINATLYQDNEGGRFDLSVRTEYYDGVREIPGKWTLAEFQAIADEVFYAPAFSGNAILNRIQTDFDTSHWVEVYRDFGGSDCDISGNYWGTTNEEMISQQIFDYYDSPGTLAKLNYAPYLTTPPENTFPFATSVTVLNKDGEAVTSVSNEEITVRITFNRDMDTSIPLTVNYGPAYPYTDQTIKGSYIDARTWEGTHSVPTTITGGQQYFRITDGCSAEDDLKLGLDTARFTFVVEQSGAQAMVLQGESNQKGIALSWMQDDFDTLMGYNIYRATEEEGWYERINQTVIPSGTNEFVDTTAEPGTTYYYYFTVVQTDLAESGPSDNLTLRHHQLARRVSEQPTCTESGWATFTCMNCGIKFEGELEPLGHEYSVEYLNQSCTEPGGERYTCTRCTDTYTENYTEPLGHDFCEWYVISDPSCSYEGQEERRCQRCATYEYRSIPVTEHSYGAMVTEPTCTEQGYTTHTCAHCGDSYADNYTEPADHSYGAWYVTKEATEDAEGEEQRDCSRCGETETRAIPKADHVHNYTSVVTDPTCTEAGYTTYTCTCGDSYTADETAALGHDFVDSKCSRCGEEKPENPFTDVPGDQWFFEPVMWAVENGITMGTTPTTFGPEKACTRSQIVTFLWRANGSPEPSGSENPFTDVKETDYFYKAVLWAVENGITMGMSATTFAPDNVCTRAQVATFLWRSVGTPEPSSSENPFTDVAEGEYYYKPVLWAVENGITVGMGNGLFAPNNECIRSQIVTFLYRALADQQAFELVHPMRDMYRRMRALQ